VLDHGGNEIEAIAALLHDAVEDAGGIPRLKQIGSRFGQEVAAIVEGCTDSAETPKPPWLKRKLAYVEHAKSASASTKLVSAADKLHNVRAILADYRTLGEKVWGRFKGGKEGSLWYYRALVEVLKCDRTFQLVDEFRRAVDELECLSNGGQRVLVPPANLPEA
jgi:(p)ppGpp synthase/HD superfamily hydrolase